jgi:glutathione S-transferase
MMKLYWSPRSRSFSALWLMEETGQPYERVLTDISTGAQKTPEYLAINPMGKVPALRTARRRWRKPPRSAPMSPSAIRSEAGAAAGDPLRAKYLYWLFFAPAASSRRWCSSRPRSRPPAGASARRCSTCSMPRCKRPVDPRRFSAADIAIGSGTEFAVGCSRWCRRGRRSSATRPAFQRASARPWIQRRENSPPPTSCRSLQIFGAASR